MYMYSTFKKSVSQDFSPGSFFQRFHPPGDLIIRCASPPCEIDPRKLRGSVNLAVWHPPRRSCTKASKFFHIMHVSKFEFLNGNIIASKQDILK
jgi:hypothetical protein